MADVVKTLDININANTDSADDSVNKWKKKVEGEPIKLEVDAEIKQAASDIATLKSKLEQLTKDDNGKLKLSVDGIDELLNELKSIGKYTQGLSERFSGLRRTMDIQSDIDANNNSLRTYKQNLSDIYENIRKLKKSDFDKLNLDPSAKKKPDDFWSNAKNIKVLNELASSTKGLITDNPTTIDLFQNAGYRDIIYQMAQLVATTGELNKEIEVSEGRIINLQDLYQKLFGTIRVRSSQLTDKSGNLLWNVDANGRRTPKTKNIFGEEALQRLQRNQNTKLPEMDYNVLTYLNNFIKAKKQDKRLTYELNDAMAAENGGMTTNVNLAAESATKLAEALAEVNQQGGKFNMDEGQIESITQAFQSLLQVLQNISTLLSHFDIAIKDDATVLDGMKEVKPITQHKNTKTTSRTRPTIDGGTRTVTETNETTTGKTGANTAAQEVVDAASELDKPHDIIIRLSDQTDLHGAIQDKINEGDYQVSVDLNPDSPLKQSIENLLNETFKANVDLNINGTGKGGSDSPSKIVNEMLEADRLINKYATGDGGKDRHGKAITDALKERGMYFSSKTGYHTNPFVFDRRHSFGMDQGLIDTIKQQFPDQELSEIVDSFMHTHPMDKYAKWSTHNEDGKGKNKRYTGDILAFYNDYVDGIKTEITAAQEEIEILNIKDFYDDLQKQYKFSTQNEQQAFLKDFVEKRKENVNNALFDNSNIKDIARIFKEQDVAFEQLWHLFDESSIKSPTGVKSHIKGKLIGKKIGDELYNYLENNLPEDFNGSFDNVIQMYVNSLLGDYSGDGANTFVNSLSKKKYGDLFNTKTNTQSRSISLLWSRSLDRTAFKKMGIDMDKYAQYVTPEEFKEMYNQSYDNGEGHEIGIGINAENIQQKIQDGIDGKEYEIKSLTLSGDADIGQKIQDAIDEKEYQINNITLGGETDIVGKIQDAIDSGDFHLEIKDVKSGEKSPGGQDKKPGETSDEKSSAPSTPPEQPVSDNSQQIKDAEDNYNRLNTEIERYVENYQKIKSGNDRIVTSGYSGPSEGISRLVSSSDIRSGYSTKTGIKRILDNYLEYKRKVDTGWRFDLDKISEEHNEKLSDNDIELYSTLANDQLDRLAAYVYSYKSMDEAQKIFGKKHSDVFEQIKERIENAKVAKKAGEDNEYGLKRILGASQRFGVPDTMNFKQYGLLDRALKTGGLEAFAAKVEELFGVKIPTSIEQAREAVTGFTETSETSADEFRDNTSMTAKDKLSTVKEFVKTVQKYQQLDADFKQAEETAKYGETEEERGAAEDRAQDLGLKLSEAESKINEFKEEYQSLKIVMKDGSEIIADATNFDQVLKDIDPKKIKEASLQYNELYEAKHNFDSLATHLENKVHSARDMDIILDNIEDEKQLMDDYKMSEEEAADIFSKIQYVNQNLFKEDGSIDYTSDAVDVYNQIADAIQNKYSEMANQVEQAFNHMKDVMERNGQDILGYYDNDPKYDVEGYKSTAASIVEHLERQMPQPEGGGQGEEGGGEAPKGKTEYVKVEVDPSSDLSGQIQDMISKGEPYKARVEIDNGEGEPHTPPQGELPPSVDGENNGNQQKPDASALENFKKIWGDKTALKEYEAPTDLATEYLNVINQINSGQMDVDSAIQRMNDKAQELGVTFDETANKWVRLSSTTTSGSDGITRTIEDIQAAYERRGDAKAIDNVLNGIYRGYGKAYTPKATLAALKSAHEAYDASISDEGQALGYNWEDQYAWAIKFVNLFEHYKSKGGAEKPLEQHEELYNRLKPLVSSYREELQRVVDFKSGSGTDIPSAKDYLNIDEVGTGWIDLQEQIQQADQKVIEFWADYNSLHNQEMDDGSPFINWSDDEGTLQRIGDRLKEIYSYRNNKDFEKMYGNEVVALSDMLTGAGHTIQQATGSKRIEQYLSNINRFKEARSNLNVLGSLSKINDDDKLMSLDSSEGIINRINELANAERQLQEFKGGLSSYGLKELVDMLKQLSGVQGTTERLNAVSDAIRNIVSSAGEMDANKISWLDNILKNTDGYTVDEIVDEIERLKKSLAKPDSLEYIKKSDYEIYESAMEMAKNRENVLEDLAQRELDIANQSTGDTRKAYIKMAGETHKLFTDGATEYQIEDKIKNTSELIQNLTNQISNEKNPQILSSLNQQLDEAKIKFLALEEVYKDIFDQANIKTPFDLEHGVYDEYWDKQRKVATIKTTTGEEHKYDIGVMDEEAFNRLTQNIHSEQDLANAIEERKQKVIELTQAYDAQEEESMRLQGIYQQLRDSGQEYRAAFEEWSAYTDKMNREDLGGQKNDAINDYQILLQLQKEWVNSISETPKIKFDYDDDTFFRISEEIDNIIYGKKDKGAKPSSTVKVEIDPASDLSGQIQGLINDGGPYLVNVGMNSESSLKSDINEALKGENFNANITFGGNDKRAGTVVDLKDRMNTEFKAFKESVTDYRFSDDMNPVIPMDGGKAPKGAYNQIRSDLSSMADDVLQLQQQYNEFNTDRPVEELKKLEEALRDAEVKFAGTYMAANDYWNGALDKTNGASKKVKNLYADIMSGKSFDIEGAYGRNTKLLLQNQQESTTGFSSIAQALRSEQETVNQIIEAEKEKFTELASHISTEIPNAIDTKNQAFKDEVSVVQDVVNQEKGIFDDFASELKLMADSLNIFENGNGFAGFKTMIENIKQSEDALKNFVTILKATKTEQQQALQVANDANIRGEEIVDPKDWENYLEGYEQVKAALGDIVDIRRQIRVDEKTGNEFYSFKVIGKEGNAIFGQNGRLLRSNYNVSTALTDQRKADKDAEKEHAAYEKKVKDAADTYTKFIKDRDKNPDILLSDTQLSKIQKARSLIWDIMDKKQDGQPLTQVEQEAIDAVNATERLITAQNRRLEIEKDLSKYQELRMQQARGNALSETDQDELRNIEQKYAELKERNKTERIPRDYVNALYKMNEIDKKANEEEDRFWAAREQEQAEKEKAQQEALQKRQSEYDKKIEQEQAKKRQDYVGSWRDIDKDNYNEQLDIINELYEAETRMNELKAQRVTNPEITSTQEWSDALNNLREAFDKAIEAKDRLNNWHNAGLITNTQYNEAMDKYGLAKKGSADSRKAIDDAIADNRTKEINAFYDEQIAKINELYEAKTRINELSAQKVTNPEIAETDEWANAIERLKQAFIEANVARRLLETVKGDISEEQYAEAEARYAEASIGSKKSREKVTTARNNKEANDINQQYREQIEIINQATEAMNRYNEMRKDEIIGQSFIGDEEKFDIVSQMERTAAAAEEAIQKLRELQSLGKITQEQLTAAENSYAKSEVGSNAQKIEQDINKGIRSHDTNLESQWLKAESDAANQAQQAIEDYYNAAKKVEDLQNRMSSGENVAKQLIKATSDLSKAADEAQKGMDRLYHLQDSGSQVVTDSIINQQLDYMNQANLISESVSGMSDSTLGFENINRAYQTLINNADRYAQILEKQRTNQSLSFNELTFLAKYGQYYQDAADGAGIFADATREVNDALKEQFEQRMETAKDNVIIAQFGDLQQAFNKLGSGSWNKEGLDKLDQFKAKMDEISETIKNLKTLSGEQKGALQGSMDALFGDIGGFTTNKDLFTDASENSVNKMKVKMSDWIQKNSAAVDFIPQVEQLKQTLDSGISVQGLREVAASFDDIRQKAIEANQTGLTFGDQLKKSFGGLARYLMTYTSFYRIIGVIKQGVNVVKELDTALMEVRKVSDESLSNLEKWQQSTFGQADQVGGSAKQIQESTAAWLRLGKQFDEAQEAAQASVKLLNVSEFTNIDDATKSLLSITQAYDELSYEDVIDKLNMVGDHFSSSTDQLAQGLQNTAAVLSTNGNDMDKALALLTAANNITQDMSKASMGVRTVALRIAGTSAAKEELQEMGEDVSDFVVQTTSKVDAQVRKYTATAKNPNGISVLDNKGRLRDTYDILLDISKVYSDIVEKDNEFGTNSSNGLLELLAKSGLYVQKYA